MSGQRFYLAGLAAGALGLVCLLGAVLRLSAPPEQQGAVSLGEPARTAPAPARDGDKATPRDQRPPVRLWRGPAPSTHPPKARKALA